jgi:aspartyl protease family protein
MMKQKIISIILISFSTLSINTYTLSAKGQDSGGCYMEGPNGEVIDLGGLCGGGGGSSPRSTGGSNSTGTASNFRVKIKRRVSGIPVVDVMFNNKKSYEMLLDTGASGTAITVRMAEQLDLEPEGMVLVSTPSDNAFPMSITTINSLKVGKGLLRNVKVIVSPSLDIGLLGQDFFRRYDLTIKQNFIEFKARR